MRLSSELFCHDFSNVLHKLVVEFSVFNEFVFCLFILIEAGGVLFTDVPRPCNRTPTLGDENVTAADWNDAANVNKKCCDYTQQKKYLGLRRRTSYTRAWLECLNVRKWVKIRIPRCDGENVFNVA